MEKKIKVLIVDDSAVVRQTMNDILSADPGIEVTAVAADPFIAAQKMREAVPDVITLDVEMPRMDGITFLQKIMSQHPIPVVICSSVAQNGSDTAFKAFEYGAVDIIAKPKLGTKTFLEESQVRICDAVKAAFLTKVKGIAHRPLEVAPKLTADAVLAKPTASHAMLETTEKVVVVGASTGGTEALKDLLEAMPQDSAGMVVVQHMPENFTRAFANRLNSTCKLSVKEGGGERHRDQGPGAHSPGEQALPSEEERREVLRRGEGRSFSVAPQAFGRRALPLGSQIRGQERHRGHHDGYG